MASFTIVDNSLEKAVDYYTQKEREEIEQIRNMFANKNIIPRLPRDYGVNDGDKKIREIIESETKKLRSRTGKRIIKKKDVRCRYGADGIPGQYMGAGSNLGSKYKYKLKYDTHGGQEYSFFETVRRYRNLYYWFGDVPGWVEDKRSRYRPPNEFPLYGTGAGEMYFKSLFPGESAPSEYVYKPYIINNQPSAKNYVYWTDYRRVCGSYVRDVYDKSGKIIHRVGDPKHPRMRSAGDKVGGRVDRTWYKKSDKGFIKRIVKKINNLPVETKKASLTMVSAVPEENKVVYGIRRKVDIKYTVGVSAKLGNKFK